MQASSILPRSFLTRPKKSSHPSVFDWLSREGQEGPEESVGGNAEGHKRIEESGYPDESDAEVDQPGEAEQKGEAEHEADDAQP